MHRNGLLLLATLCAYVLGAFAVCAAAEVTHLAIGDPERKDKTVPVVLDAVTDTRTGELLSPPQLAERLAGVDMLVIGESHTDIESHNVQLRVIQELHRAGRQVLVGLEMFPYTQQEHLDRWAKKMLSENDFVESAEWYKYWGYHWNYYRDIFLFARDNGVRMFGVNVPRETISKVRTEGFDALDEEQQAHVPPSVDTDNDEQREMFKAFFEDDDELHAMLDDEAWEGMFRAQCTWDAAMGWNALKALKDHGGENAIMVVLIGSGHVTYGLGLERQVRLHHDGEVATLIPVDLDDDEEEPTVQASYANFVWGVPEFEYELYPSLGVSLSGSIGPEPRKVIQVSEHSPAEMAGVEVGDVILGLGDTVIDASPAMREAIAGYRWGDVAPLQIERNGERMSLEVPFRRVLVDEDDSDNEEEEEEEEASDEHHGDAKEGEKEGEHEGSEHG